ncbi:MAG: hypothetical protein ACR2H3_12875 [Acidimicrobiales bacterium]
MGLKTLRRVSVGAVVAALAVAPLFVVGAFAAASPCAPGQPTGRPPGEPPTQAPGQPAIRPSQYPPGQCQLELSRSVSQQGGQLQVSGSGYDPNSTVNLELFSTPRNLGSVTADAQGQFAATVTIPLDAEVGAHTLSATGFRNGAPYQLTADLTVTAAGVTGVPTNVGGGSLPRTGAFIAGLTALGAALTGAGTVAVLAARRRRATQAV